MATNFRPTCNLRWSVIMFGTNKTLQQEWVSDDGMTKEWRDIPNYFPDMEKPKKRTKRERELHNGQP